MPKKPNYSFEKRKKELDRKAKKEEKLRRKREGGRDDDTLSDADGETDAGASGEAVVPE